MGVTAWKAVKPARLRDEEFKRLARNMARRVAYGMRQDLERTTATWEHEVKFHEHTSVLTKTGDIAAGADTDDEVWLMLEHGTRPHPIWAGYYTGKSDKKVLAFMSGFEPKTTPRRIDAQEGWRGGEMVYRPYVQHPGTEPRHWIEEINKIWEPRFRNEVIQLFREFRRLSGHAA